MKLIELKSKSTGFKIRKSTMWSWFLLNIEVIILDCWTYFPGDRTSLESKCSVLCHRLNKLEWRHSAKSRIGIHIQMPDSYHYYWKKSKVNLLHLPVNLEALPGLCGLPCHKQDMCSPWQHLRYWQWFACYDYFEFIYSSSSYILLWIQSVFAAALQATYSMDVVQMM